MPLTWAGPRRIRHTVDEVRVGSAPKEAPGATRRNRKWKWDPVLANRVLLLIARGLTLVGAARRASTPERKLTDAEIRWWAVKDFEGFADELAEARVQQQHARIDSVHEEGRALMALAKGKTRRVPKGDLKAQKRQINEDARLIQARAQAFREYRESVHWQAQRFAAKDFWLNAQKGAETALELPFDVDAELIERLDRVLESLAGRAGDAPPAQETRGAPKPPVH